MTESVNEALEVLSRISDEDLAKLSFVMPWQVSEGAGSDVDADGFPINSSGKGGLIDREALQMECWNKFNDNPQISTSVKGQVGRLTGFGFETSSEIQKIQDVLEEIELDQRNRLYLFWPKFVGRSIIEGELFLLLTVHKDGFIEVDFIDPSSISGGGTDGVVYHPTKATMPLFYFVKQENENGISNSIPIPSVFIARYPELEASVKNKLNGHDANLLLSKGFGKMYKAFGGYKRFIVSWDKSFMTRRNVSYLRTILVWLNHYETLKKYEIDHKKSAGAYLWVVTMEDPKAFRSWMALSDEERRKTGIMAKKTPGSTLVLPPGMKMEAKNPALPSISESDTDIFHMITSGLNEPEDVTSGQSKGTFASVKASRGPMADRTMDESAYFERFLRYDFWGSIFFLKSKVASFPEFFDQKVAVDFKGQEPVFKNVKKRPEALIEICFPSSEVVDVESKARAYMGVKHGSVNESLGIPHAEIAKKLGFGNYKKLRLRHATEEDRYPKLAPSIDQEGVDDGDESREENKDSVVKKKELKIRKKEDDK